MHAQSTPILLEQFGQEDTESLSSRIFFCLKYRNISQTELAKAIGVTPQNIQALCSGKIKKSRHINEIAAYLNVDPFWLATGSSTSNNQYSTQLAEVSQIPILFWQTIGDGNKPPYEGLIKGAFDHSDLTYALKVQDNSMSPKFEIGDILLISEGYKADHGDYIIAKISANNQYICRIYHRREDEIKLIALNPAYGIINQLETEFEIVGIVKESRINLKYENH